MSDKRKNHFLDPSKATNPDKHWFFDFGQKFSPPFIKELA
jgi:hypothetical protein